MLGKGPPGGSWHRMDPNLRTLSLAAWMSLPSLDFVTWESLHMEESIADRNTIQVGLSPQSPSSNSKKWKSLKNSCIKCQECRENDCGRSERMLLENNNNSEVSPRDCNCSKVSHKFNLTDGKRLTVKEVKSKEPIRSSDAQHPKEPQSRALVSKVAKYYESYVTQMKLQKYFVNDVVVTSIVPIHWKDSKCKGRWIVVGYVCPFSSHYFC